jgi:hypothetical protein
MCLINVHHHNIVIPLMYAVLLQQFSHVSVIQPSSWKHGTDVDSTEGCYDI